MLFKVALVFLLIAGVTAFIPRGHPQGFGGQLRKIEMPSTSFLSKAVQVASGSALLFPAVAHADSSSAVGAVAIPLVISVAVIFPFIYYANQLKPKERTVKQIELDKNLKPIKDKSTGGIGAAKATKKTK